MGLPELSKNLLLLIQRNGPLTKNDLIEVTALKLTTLNRFLKPLTDEHWIVRSGTAGGNVGRPSSLLEINRDARAVIGVDISRTSVNILVLSLGMDIIDRHTFPVTAKTSQEAVIDRICQKIIGFEKKHAGRTFLTVGIGMIGPIDTKTGQILHLEPLPVGMTFDFDIRDVIHTRTGLPVSIESGAGLALLAESAFGEARNYTRIAYISSGIGIRSSYRIDDQPLKTPHAREDTLAHMTVDSSGFLCTCGRRGCVEAYSSLHALLDAYTEKTGETLDYRTFLERAHSGNPIALSLLDHAAEILGIGIANNIRTLGLDYIILSGPLVEHSTLFYNRVMESALTQVQNAFTEGFIFDKGGTFAHNSIAVGAALYGFESYLER